MKVQEETHVCEKRRIYVDKDLQKRPIYVEKETYVYEKTDLCVEKDLQKSPISRAWTRTNF